MSSNEGYIQGALVATLLAASVQVALRAGVLSFAGAGFYGVGAYGLGYLTTTQGWGTPAAMLVLLVGTVIASWLLALVLARLRALYLAMATIAFVLLVHIAALAWDGVTGGPIGMYGIPPVLSTGSVALIVLGILVINALSQRGARGRSLLALRLDEPLAGALGIDVRRAHRAAFVWSAVIGSVAGFCQVTLLTVFTPENVGFPVVVSALTALVVGGAWHWAGPFVGAVVFAWMPVYLGAIGEWRAIVEGVLTVIVLIYLPHGIVGTVSAMSDRARAMGASRRDTGAAADDSTLEKETVS
ncbi:branched-chain amino acid ABC transporter permease [Aeromicrobium sp. UC242_57]|uniref:branched-chain amino acid ABC transporter permease n=1 Tax=Aeromicrobium sp. UC242_57 TaxID=3374624 RepID=UPI003798360D